MFKISRNAFSTANEETKYMKYPKYIEPTNDEPQNSLNIGLKQLKASELPSVPICNEQNIFHESTPQHYSFGSQKKMRSKAQKLK